MTVARTFIFSILVFIFSNCSNQSSLEQYLINLTKVIDQEALKEFSTSRNYPISNERYNKEVYKEIKKSLQDDRINEMITIHIDSVFNKGTEESLKISYVEIMLFAYLNGDDLNFEKLVKKYQTNAELIHIKSHIKRLKAKEEVARKNNKTFAIGDTIVFDFHNPFKHEKRIGYPEAPLPDSIFTEEKIEISGVILDKIQIYDNEFDMKFEKLIFDIKILSINHPEVYYGTKLVDTSEIFHLNVTSYGKLLKPN